MEISKWSQKFEETLDKWDDLLKGANKLSHNEVLKVPKWDDPKPYEYNTTAGSSESLYNQVCINNIPQFPKIARYVNLTSINEISKTLLLKNIHKNIEISVKPYFQKSFHDHF